MIPKGRMLETVLAFPDKRSGQVTIRALPGKIKALWRCICAVQLVGDSFVPDIFSR